MVYPWSNGISQFHRVDGLHFTRITGRNIWATAGRFPWGPCWLAFGTPRTPRTPRTISCTLSLFYDYGITSIIFNMFHVFHVGGSSHLVSLGK